MGLYSDYQPTEPTIVQLDYQKLSTTAGTTTTDINYFVVDSIQKFDFYDTTNNTLVFDTAVDIADTATEYANGTSTVNYTVGDLVKVTSAGLKFKAAANFTINHSKVDTTAVVSGDHIAGSTFLNVDDGAVFSLDDIISIGTGLDKYQVVGIAGNELEIVPGLVEAASNTDVVYFVEVGEYDDYHPMNPAASMPNIAKLWSEAGTMDEYAALDKSKYSRLELTYTECAIIKFVVPQLIARSDMDAVENQLDYMFAASGLSAHRAILVFVVNGVIEDYVDIDLTNRHKLSLQVSPLGNFSRYSGDLEYYLWLFPSEIPDSLFYANQFPRAVTTTDFLNTTSSFVISEDGLVLAQDTGNVEIYDNIAGTWTYRNSITTSDSSARFLSLDGTGSRVVFLNSTNNSQEVWYWDTTTWVKEFEYFNGVTGTESYTNCAINTAGDLIAFSESRNREFHFYSRSGTTWTKTSDVIDAEQSLTFTGLTQLDGAWDQHLEFLDDGDLMVGFSRTYSIHDGVEYARTGAIFIFTYTTQWDLLEVVSTKDTSSANVGGITGLATSNNKILFKATVGKVYLWERVNGVYSLTNTFARTDTYTHDDIGLVSSGTSDTFYTKDAASTALYGHTRDTSSTLLTNTPQVGEVYTTWISNAMLAYGIGASTLFPSKNLKIGNIATGRAQHITGTTEFGLSINSVPTREVVNQYGIETLETIDIIEDYTATIIVESATSAVAAKYLLDTSIVNDVIIHSGADDVFGENWILGKISSTSVVDNASVFQFKVKGTSLGQELVDRVVPRDITYEGWK